MKEGAFLAAAIVLGSCAAPTATVSSSPIASASGIPAASACGPVAHEATGTVLFASDLSGRCKKNQLQPAEMFVGAGANFERVQGPDDYRLLLKPDYPVDAGGLARISQYDSAPPADVQIEVDAQAIAGSIGSLYGIMCRFNSPINTPTVSIPGKLSVFMNSQKIVSVDHGEQADGLSGVWARTLGTAGAEIVFRNFVVSKP